MKRSANFASNNNLEQARFGGWVPATMLLNTGPALRELLLLGYIISNGVGFAPAGKADRHG